MTEYTTFSTIGNKPGALRDYIVKQYAVTRDQAQSVLDSEPMPTKGEGWREDQYQWMKRVVTKTKAL